ncbi:MAG TPA: HAMP domain-containing sensor histidine kinase [Gaiellaceae bacterium]
MIESARQGTRARLYAALLDEATEPILALDADGKIVHANAAAARAFRRQRRHLIGKPFAGLLALTSRRAIRTAFSAVGHAPSRFHVELEGADSPTTLTLRRLTGAEGATLIATLGVGSPPGTLTEPVVGIAAALDRFFLRYPLAVIGLSDERRVMFVNPRARQLLGESNVRIGRILPAGALADFADRVVALTAVAQTARLEMSATLTLRATGLGPRGAEPAVLILDDVTSEEQRNHVMHEFVRNAAHQLRTPLTGIATAVEVLQAGAKNDPIERDRFLNHVETHSRRLIRIARGLLVLARAQSGEHLRLEFVELRPLLEELAAQSRPQPGVKISIDCDPALAVLAERDLAHEVLAALVDNAVQHTREGSIQLTAEETNGTVVIAVSDTGGVGVLPEHRERIFEPFYRPQVSGDGFGLGLAIAAQATKAMDGQLAVEDGDGGARFTIRLASGRILR